MLTPPSIVESRPAAPARVVAGSQVWFWWGSAAGLLALAVFAGLRLQAYRLDDAFITYRYAANLAAGHGFVYNLGEPVLSTTSPLFALLLGGLGRLGPDIPTTGYWLGVFGLAATAFGIVRIGALAGRRDVGFIAAVVVVFSPDLMFTFGLESTLFLSLAVAAIWATLAGRLGVAGVLLGFATLARGDAAMLAGVLLVAWVVQRRQIPWRAIAGWAAVTVPWAVFATWYFGWPLPVTLTAKMLQGQSSFWLNHFLDGILVAGREWHVDISPLFWVFPALWVVGLYEVLVRDRRWLIWSAWAGLHSVAYSLLNVPYYYWYYAPLVPALAVLTALGVSRLSRWAAGLTGAERASLVRWGTVAGLLVPLLVAQVQLFRHVERQVPFPFSVAYRDLGLWLDANLPPNSSIGTLEIGLLGYYSGRPMVDFAGLLQPPVARHVARDDFEWAVEAYQPEYVVWSPTRDRWLTNSPEFAERYEEISHYPNSYLDPLIISRRRG